MEYYLFHFDYRKSFKYKTKVKCALTWHIFMETQFSRFTFLSVRKTHPGWSCGVNRVNLSDRIFHVLFAMIFTCSRFLVIHVYSTYAPLPSPFLLFFSLFLSPSSFLFRSLILPFASSLSFRCFMSVGDACC